METPRQTRDAMTGAVVIQSLTQLKNYKQITQREVYAVDSDELLTLAVLESTPATLTKLPRKISRNLFQLRNAKRFSFAFAWIETNLPNNLRLETGRHH